MKDITKHRIYVQLQPDKSSREQLLAVQSDVPLQKTGRLIEADELHMTIIHFGKTEDVYKLLHDELNIDKAAFNTCLQHYIADTKQILHSSSFQLKFTGYDLFGPKKTALVAQFNATNELQHVHRKALHVLMHFFAAAGVANVASFMANDGNFRHALTLNPHVTLYKGFYGEVPNTQLESLQFKTMKLLY